MSFVDVDKCGSDGYGTITDVYLHSGANNARDR